MMQQSGSSSDNPFRKWSIVALVISVAALVGLVVPAIFLPADAMLIAGFSLFVLIVALIALLLLFFYGLVYWRIMRILAGGHRAHLPTRTYGGFISHFGLF